MDEAVARYTGLPVERISDDVLRGAEQLGEMLAKGVGGQPDACQAAARVLARFKAGLNDPERPVGSLFFVGPTGVGKTELAKQLTRTMFGDTRRLVRLDMSEYMLPGSAQRLMATGRGVTSLAEQVRREPLSLVLLDEVEKAHPEVFDLLLGVLGEGRLTDREGRRVDLRMAVIVMTSNLGVTRSRSVGFGETAPDFLGAVRKHFRPEFFNRIDAVVPFRSLMPEDIERIVELEVAKLGEREGLKRRGLRLKVDRAARELLAELGWHPLYGARPLKRVIEERVMTPLAIRMAREPELGRCTLVASRAGDEIELVTLS